jgi:hypothetical protein
MPHRADSGFLAVTGAGPGGRTGGSRGSSWRVRATTARPSRAAQQLPDQVDTENQDHASILSMLVWIQAVWVTNSAACSLF